MLQQCVQVPVSVSNKWTASVTCLVLCALYTESSCLTQSSLFTSWNSKCALNFVSIFLWLSIFLFCMSHSCLKCLSLVWNLLLSLNLFQPLSLLHALVAPCKKLVNCTLLFPVPLSTHYRHNSHCLKRCSYSASITQQLDLPGKHNPNPKSWKLDIRVILP